MAVGSICFRRQTVGTTAGIEGNICLSRREGAAGRIAFRSDVATVRISPASVKHFSADGSWWMSDLFILANFIGREDCKVGFGFENVYTSFETEDEAFSLRLLSRGTEEIGDERVLVVAPKGGWAGVAPSVLRVRFTSWATGDGFYNRVEDKAGMTVNPSGGDELKSVGGLEIPSGRIGYEYAKDYTRAPYVDITFGANGEVLDMKHVAGR